jgi:hypothetical protein
MLLRVKAKFARAQEYGFYHAPGDPGRRYRDGETFNFFFDESKTDRKGNKIPLEKQLGSWMVLLDEPKKKPGPKKKEGSLEALNVDNELRDA